jgi:hypothetical protein
MDNLTPANIVARQTADRMSHERALRCVRACAGLSDAALSQDVIAVVREALEAVMVGGNHLALYMDSDKIPHTATHDEAQEFYGPDTRYDIWVAWSRIMKARAALALLATDKGE